MRCEEDSCAYNVLCVWPGLLLGNTPPDEVTQWFRQQFQTRISNIEEIQSLYRLSDGSYRDDMVFRIHEADVSTFAIQRLNTDIKWWGDWVTDLGHRNDYTEVQIERFRIYEFNTQLNDQILPRKATVNHYLSQLIGFNRNRQTGNVDIDIAVCSEDAAKIYGRNKLIDLRDVDSTRIYTMAYQTTDNGLALEPDDDFDDCLLTHEVYSDEDIQEDETHRKVQTVEVVEGILEILRDSNLVGINVGESNIGIKGI